MPLPTLRRLPFYHDLFKERQAVGDEWLSSETIGMILGFGAIQVRKDLRIVGAEGIPKRGYRVAQAVKTLEDQLGASENRNVFLIGSGVLAEAVAEDQGLARHGFHIVGVFDLTPESAERHIAGMQVLPLVKLADLRKRLDVHLAVLAVDADQAGAAALALARAGIRAVLDLSGATTLFPEDILVIRESIGAKLAALAGELNARP